MEIELDDNTPPRQLTLVVLLFVHPDKRSQFEEFEAAASSIMARYGGRITQRIATDSSPAGNRPYELHIVSFPDEEAFERYRIDEELAALRDLRASAIRETIIWRGTQLEPWKSGDRAPP